MRLWLNRTGELTLREQLITQVVLAILCKELVPGQRLPSTRDLARRFNIHANTASAAYRELEREGWVEFRHGSGVYVRANRPAVPLSPENAAEFVVDRLIGELVAKARKQGATESLLRSRLYRWLSVEPPSRWLVVEPDPDLRAGVTVPNHIHLLTAVQGPNSDQLVFDQTFTAGEARFHPPSLAETIVKQSAAGAKKAAQSAGYDPLSFVWLILHPSAFILLFTWLILHPSAFILPKVLPSGLCAAAALGACDRRGGG